MSKDKKAVVLSSGGLDSTTVMAIVKDKGYDIYSLSFDYGQRHVFELQAARRVAEIYQAKAHLVVKTDLTAIGGSALTAGIDVPKNREREKQSTDIPVTYVPARNTIFLAYALAWSEVLQTPHLFIGVNAVDYSGYPDCRPEYIQAFEKMARLATKAGVQGLLQIRIHTPLIQMSKAEIILAGSRLNVDYGMTHSCYDPDPSGRACGSCDSCELRRKGFMEAGISDPTIYAS